MDDTDGELLRYLAGLGLQLGTSVTVLSREPFNGPLTLAVDNDERLIGFKAASAVFVE